MASGDHVVSKMPKTLLELFYGYRSLEETHRNFFWNSHGCALPDDHEPQNVHICFSFSLTDVSICSQVIATPEGWIRFNAISRKFKLPPSGSFVGVPDILWEEVGSVVPWNFSTSSIPLPDFKPEIPDIMDM